MMGKGFDTFMRNPYYREMYENAPTEYLKASLRHEWDNSPFITGGEPDDIPPMQNARPYNRQELEYLLKYAGSGMEKAYYKRRLSQLDEDGIKYSREELERKLKDSTKPWDISYYKKRLAQLDK